MTRKQRRMTLMGGVFVVAALAVGLVLTALNSTVAYFYTPTTLAALPTPPNGAIRLGGLVEAGSVVYGDKRAAAEKALVRFAITDQEKTTGVVYAGVLPDLFREGQGVVVQGVLRPDGVLEAAEVLAKHDETYMPKEVADALKEQGRWRNGAYGDDGASTPHTPNQE